MVGTAVVGTRIDLCIMAMLIAPTMNYSWLARLVAGHCPAMPMVPFCFKVRTGRQLRIIQGANLVMVGLSLKDGASLRYAEDTRAIGFVAIRDCVVVVLEDNSRWTVVQVLTML